MYKVQKDSGFLIGIEIARVVQVLLLDIEFNILNRKMFSVTTEHTPEVTISIIIDMIKQLIQTHQLSANDIIGIGIGAVGPLDRKNGRMINPESFIAPGWDNVPIINELQKEFPVPIIINNGANTAALAEYQAQLFSSENLLYCISGYGIRCGFIHAGISLNSRQGDASSYGHIIVEPGGRLCSCGKRGCLNAYSSFGAMFEQIKREVPSLELTSSSQLVEALTQKVQIVEKVVLESAYYYGLAIANMMNLLHPDVVLLQGRLIEESGAYLNKVISIATDHAYSSRSQDIIIRKGQLGRDAVAVGAAVEVFQSFFSKE
ncbi:ROK family protein [Alkalihalobacillus sp. BA299]|uniref:ROK family protein n=1 Tax=Alkalihalobacillus sp. BA299 TaxID=2815938 RepID=UPI001AD97C6F|nr:ROK family protein [Alkalihalobacillus sp. BA299]